MEQNEYYDTFGLEQPQEEPEQEPAEQEPQEPEEPAGEEETGSTGPEPQEPEQQPEPDDDQNNEEPPAQSQEDNARFAAVRRRAEQEARRRSEQLISGLGLTNPDGTPVTTWEQAEAYRVQHQKNVKQEMMESNGWSQEQYNTFVGSIPEVQAARAQIAQARMDQARAQLDRDLVELQKLDPTVKSLEDLAAKPDQEKFEGYVRKGLSLADAYKLTYGDELLARQGKAARQAAINDLRSKEHLVPDNKRGTGVAEVPQEIREQYKLFNPDSTDEEIQKNYNEYLKSTKK